jgi:hypothetical protein
MTAAAIETITFVDVKSAPENPWAHPTFAAIGPHGQIVIRHMTPGKMGEIGDVPILAIDGYPVLSPRYKKAGWCLYEDLCKGEVKGVDADPEAWRRWLTVCQLRAAGRDLPSGVNDDTFYHPEVARRRSMASNGSRTLLTVAELRELLPGVEIGSPEDDED